MIVARSARVTPSLMCRCCPCCPVQPRTGTC